MITQKARELLAEEYRATGKPWFAVVALNPDYHQFDVALTIISRLS
jgi:hypothetical protein